LERLVIPSKVVSIVKLCPSLKELTVLSSLGSIGLINMESIMIATRLEKLDLRHSADGGLLEGFVRVLSSLQCLRSLSFIVSDMEQCLCLCRKVSPLEFGAARSDDIDGVLILPNLEHLAIRDTSLWVQDTRRKEFCDALFSILQSREGLKSFSVSGCQLDVTLLFDLKCQNLWKCKNLENLELSLRSFPRSVEYSYDEKSAMCQAVYRQIAQCIKLKSLSICSDDIHISKEYGALELVGISTSSFDMNDFSINLPILNDLESLTLIRAAKSQCWEKCELVLLVNLLPGLRILNLLHCLPSRESQYNYVKCWLEECGRGDIILNDR
jgi:hypothetical protein